MPTCPHAARTCRLAFSSRMLVSVCSWTTESRSPLLASSTSMGHTGSWSTSRRNGALLSMRPTTFLSAFLHVFAQTSVAVGTRVHHRQAPERGMGSGARTHQEIRLWNAPALPEGQDLAGVPFWSHTLTDGAPPGAPGAVAGPPRSVARATRC